MMSSQPRIIYSRRFEKQLDALPDEVQKKVAKTFKLFSENIFHPSLRLHKLSGHMKGLWSINIDAKYRMVLEPLQDNVYLFISVGTHAIYEKT
jgi:addiction module RelE/StbE family toxin